MRNKGTQANTTGKGKPVGKAASAERSEKMREHFMNFYDVRLSESQHVLYRKIMDNNITVVTGPAGASKTFTACYAALKLLEKGEVEKIILTKPIQESGEKLGFLPGDVKEKTDPYMESYLTNMAKIVDSKDIGGLVTQFAIEVKPLAYMRGAGYDNCVMILDEAQNCDFRQLMLYVTRMGKNSKIIAMGDVSQYDIAKNKIALPKFAEMISDIPGVATHQFTKQDIVRHPMLIAITDRYDEWKDKGLTTENK